MVGGAAMSILGDRLRQLRESKGWSQRYVASKIGMKQSSTYANWEYGLRDPDTDTLSRLADLYEVTTDDLLGRESNPESLPKDNSEYVLKEMLANYNVNLNDPKEKEKLEKIIQLVFGDMKNE